MVTHYLSRPDDLISALWDVWRIEYLGDGSFSTVGIQYLGAENVEEVQLFMSDYGRSDSNQISLLPEWEEGDPHRVLIGTEIARPGDWIIRTYIPGFEVWERGIFWLLWEPL